ncbi:hypothetical protein HOP52_08360 [Halomonas campisalis]|uniref:Uncharacterized protein n=1 Tax=Billgrantia campisalis TaxID=74661 RepID=A0ABS9P7N4_9GAMM|nr:hypothetical protein [Halomonas campisalis]MCG6657768.1 hypothetical protein [Halomonas campisalis]MDR5862460.1 hypothetical protein [Halomonas campisalis]
MRESLERHQVWIYRVAIVGGLGLGLSRPAGAEALEGALWPLLAVLLFATFTQVPLNRHSLAFLRWVPSRLIPDR